MYSYFGRHAELYDIFYKDKKYKEEAEFVHNCLQRYSGGRLVHRLLELACGTGSHSFALEKFGYQIIATDNSEDMLARARTKVLELNSKVEFQLEDMRSLDLLDEQFDAVICLFDSIGYVVTNEALERVLLGVYRNLKPGGLFLFEFWHAGAMLRSYDPMRVGNWQTEDGEILRISRTSLEAREQLARVKYQIYELRKNGTFSSFEETQLNRYFLVQEMAGWLTHCGFVPIKWFAGYTYNETITEDTWHIVTVSKRDQG